MDVSQNSATPQIIHFHRVFHYFHHPFWGTPIFGNTHMAASPHPPCHHQTRWQVSADALSAFGNSQTGCLRPLPREKKTVLDHVGYPHQDPTFKLFGNPLKKDYFKGNPKSLNFYFLVIWWVYGKWWYRKPLGWKAPICLTIISYVKQSTRVLVRIPFLDYTENSLKTQPRNHQPLLKIPRNGRKEMGNWGYNTYKWSYN